LIPETEDDNFSYAVFNFKTVSVCENLYCMYVGPLEFIKEEYNGSLPNLILKPHSWTKVDVIVHIFFIAYFNQFNQIMYL
jgi:hypothetical protein